MPPQISLLLLSETETESLPLCLSALRQQGLTPSDWEILLVQGPQARLPIHGSPLPLRQLSVSATGLGAQLFQILSEVKSSRVLLFNPHFLPHRDLLQAHLQLHRQQPEALAVGSNHLHPRQLMSLFALSAQQEGLLFPFFPLEAPPAHFAHFALHNCSLPLSRLQSLSSDCLSARFLAWDLGLQLWQQGLRPQYLPQASSSLLQALSLESALMEWEKACKQDLERFLAFGLGPEFCWSSGPLPIENSDTEFQPLRTELLQSQHEICIPVEAGDAAELRLKAWRQKLRRLWALQSKQVLSDPKPDRQRQRALVQWLSSQTPQTEELKSGDLEVWRQTLQNQGFMGHNLDSKTLKTTLKSQHELPPLLLISPSSLPELLRHFVPLSSHLPAGSLFLFPQLNPAVQDFQNLLTKAYPCLPLQNQLYYWQGWPGRQEST